MDYRRSGHPNVRTAGRAYRERLRNRPLMADGVLPAPQPAVTRAWARSVDAANFADREAIDDAASASMVPALLSGLNKCMLRSSNTPASLRLRSRQHPVQAGQMNLSSTIPNAIRQQVYTTAFCRHGMRQARPAAFLPNALFCSHESIQFHKERIQDPSTCHRGSLHGSLGPWRRCKQITCSTKSCNGL